MPEATEPTAVTPSPGPTRAAALAALAAILGCQDTYPPSAKKSDPTAASARPAPESEQTPAQKPAQEAEPAPVRAPDKPLREEPTKLDLGNSPIRNPLNIYDVGLAGAPDYKTAGTIDGVAVTMRDLEAQSVGAFSRIARRIYRARDGGYRWLLERVALDKQAAAANKPLIPFLLAQYSELPEPTDADLAAILAEVPLASLPDQERRWAAVSLWRLAAWEQKRHELVLAGRADLTFERVRQKITSPEYAKPDNVVARLEGKPITRADLRALAGYEAELARHEYWRIAKLQFDKYVNRFLREREAQLLDVDADELVALEAKRIPPATEADVRAFIKENPEYGRDPKGYERARDNLRRLRTIKAETMLDTRLREAAEVRFALDEPEIGRFAVEVPAPRWHGPASANNVLVAFHSVGCETCTRGSRLLLSILARRPDLKLLAGDYFTPGRLDSYRGALALHCAPPESRDALLAALVDDFGTGEIAALSAKAEAAGIAVDKFRACLLRDAFLPLIVENLAMARRLGLERDIPGLFVNGIRIGELKDIDKVLEQVDQALSSVEP